MEADSPKPRESLSGDPNDARGPSYESRLKALSPIAQPLASKKLTKRLLKVVKKAAKSKNVRRGVKEVVKGLRKGAKGIVVIAGDISPIDVITHVPILCEEADVPYCYVPSKEDLGQAGSTKRPTSCIMVVPAKGEADEGYLECIAEVKAIGEATYG
ncbi:50S ribosomal protein L30e-like protein [Hyaloraphidium curvatum]|nr:50S ribosomal protein L30e-like protein [Hyaloraphidium curvatum]